MTNSAISNEIFFLVFLVFIEVLFIFIAFIVKFWIPFIKERGYIKMEINRSSGGERKYWERELKIFYASHIPFLRYFIYKKKRKK